MIRNRAVRLVIAVSAAVTFTSASFLVVEPLYARHVLHRPPSQFALFEAAAAGTGAILAGLVISRIRSRLTGGTTLMAAAIGYGLAACLFTRYHLGVSRLCRRLLVGCGRIDVRRGCGHYTPAGRPCARARPGHEHQRHAPVLDRDHRPTARRGDPSRLAPPDALALAGVALAAGLIGMTIVTARPGGDVSRVT